MTATDPIPDATEPEPAALTEPTQHRVDATMQAAVTGLRAALESVYRGHPDTISLVIIALIAGGHVLLEDIPGVGKTTLARALAAAIGGDFRRLQCTPDLMPADITGISIYDEQQKGFMFHQGPIFCDVLLADELNRTPPRTQSALLEAMSEGQVTIDGVARPLQDTFFCIATQNPHDHVGTYPLPDSQRDRFLLRFDLGYPSREQELDLLDAGGTSDALAALRTVCDLPTVRSLRRTVQGVHVAPEVRLYLMDLVEATRRSKQLQIGASPRAALGLQRAAQARALLMDRSFIIPEDIQALAIPALAHRVAARVGQQATTVVRNLVESLNVPR